jgi:hypothetical protein
MAVQAKIKKVGKVLRWVWNLILAGKTITIKGVPIRLPEITATQKADVEPTPLEDLVK